MHLRHAPICTYDAPTAHIVSNPEYWGTGVMKVILNTTTAVFPYLPKKGVQSTYLARTLMGVLDVILRQLTLVLPALLVDGVHRVFLLEEHVPSVSDVGEDHFDIGIDEPEAALRRNALGSQFTFGLQPGLPVKEVLKDAPDDSCFLRNDDQMIVFPFVAEDAELSVGDALLEALDHAPLDVLGNAAAI